MGTEAPTARSLRTILRHGLTPATVFHLAVMALVPFWFGPVTYLLLRTYKFAPSGIVAWVLIVAQVVFAVWVLGSAFRRAAAFGKKFGPLRQAYESGDETVRDELFQLRKQKAQVTRVPLIAVTGFFFLLPAYFAIALGNTFSGGKFEVEVNGQSRYSTQQEDIDRILQTFEEHHLMVPWK